MRHFVSFKKDTTLYGKLMPFTNLNRNEIQDILVEEYNQKWDKIYTEPEASRILYEIYQCKDNWVPYGTECLSFSKDNKVTLEPITAWFKVGIPKPLDKDKCTQLGALTEEMSELLSVLKNNTTDADLQNQAVKAFLEVSALSKMLYSQQKLDFTDEQKVEMLDALADIVVTTTAVAYTQGFKWDKALTEVNQSNFSKFVGGKPIYNEHGKIMKGKNYRKPNLENFV